jgi:hypothetical protein
MHLNACLDPRTGCARQPWCRVHRVWVDAQARMTDVLASAWLDNLARLASADAVAATGT